MATHLGPRPAGQPRTLRSIAEDKGTAPANRVDTADVPGLPPHDYHDEAAHIAKGSPTRAPGPEQPRPFALKGGGK